MAKKSPVTRVKKEDNATDQNVDIEKLVNYGMLNGKFLLVKIGSDNRPASTEDIEELENKLESLFTENQVDCLALVTNHTVEIEIIG